MAAILSWPQCVNTLMPRQNGPHFADNILKLFFLSDNNRFYIQISLFYLQGSDSRQACIG